MPNQIPRLALNLDGDDVQVGTFVQTPSPVMAEFLATLPFDFLCLDAEHSAFDESTLERCVCATERHGKPCLVRVAGSDGTLISKALDAGVAGILVPRVETADQAAAIVDAARFPPQGRRGCGPARAANYGSSIPEYIQWADEHVIVAVQIETRLAVANLEEILSIPGIDLFFIGPGDLSLSFREKSGQGFADVGNVIENIISKARKQGVRLAMYAFGPEDLHFARSAGMRAVVLQSDLTFTAKAALEALQRSQEAS